MVDMEISKDIKWIGASDNDLTLFEGQYMLENGMSYNSYLIKDEKNVILDTIDERVTNIWIEKFIGFQMVFGNYQKGKKMQKNVLDIFQRKYQNIKVMKV